MNDGRFALRFELGGRTGDRLRVALPAGDLPQPVQRPAQGRRPNIVADLKPAFIRWPGGCIVEGLTMENRVNWKNTIGKPELRKGEYNLWGYHSTNGFGYHEFLQYCEDIGAQAMFVCNAGMSCDGRNGDYYDDKEVEVLIQDALDAIEYATGDAETTKWGAERAKNGHPAPFTLDYIEVSATRTTAPCTPNITTASTNVSREAYPDITIITCLPMSDQLSSIEPSLDVNESPFLQLLQLVLRQHRLLRQSSRAKRATKPMSANTPATWASVRATWKAR